MCSEQSTPMQEGSWDPKLYALYILSYHTRARHLLSSSLIRRGLQSTGMISRSMSACGSPNPKRVALHPIWKPDRSHSIKDLLASFLTLPSPFLFGLLSFCYRSVSQGAMAGGGVVNTGKGKEYPGQLTLFVFLTCIVAATGGLIFGYDIGISGVTSVLVAVFFLSLFLSWFGSDGWGWWRW